MGSAAAALAAGAKDFVAVDMGGTSFDICLVRDGQPDISTDWNWRYRYYIGMPMVDVQCVGAGGGSMARVRQGSLLVGPESAGSAPGPACYGRGGDHATVTDADLVLGYLPGDRFAGGRMTLDADAAAKAIERDVAEPLGMNLVDAAWGIERIVNANMADATRRVLAGSGVDARQLELIAYGGNGPVHAGPSSRGLGVHLVLVPEVGSRVQRAGAARLRLQGRSHPHLRQPAVARRRRPAGPPARRARRGRHRRAGAGRPRPTRRRPGPGASRWPTPARTST